MQSDESWLSRAMLRCSLTSRQQRYNTSIPFSKFFRCLISHLESLPHLRIGIQPFIYGHSCAFSTREKKRNRDITFYPMPMLKTYEAATFCLPQCHLHTFLLLIHAFSSLSHQSMPQRSIARQTRKGLESRKTSLQALLF